MLATATTAPTRTKAPEVTRARLLECAFEEIYRHGYAGASLDRILSKTGLTKGALYHHFKNKAELAYAVIEEVIGGQLEKQWLAPLRASDDPATALSAVLMRFVDGDTPLIEIEHGCPLNNLTQELADLDEGFRVRLMRVFEAWYRGIAQALERGQAAGTVRRDLDPAATATFIVSSLEGLAGTAKSTRNLPLVMSAGEVLMKFFETLRPQAGVASTRRRTRQR